MQNVSPNQNRIKRFISTAWDNKSGKDTTKLNPILANYSSFNKKDLIKKLQGKYEQNQYKNSLPLQNENNTGKNIKIQNCSDYSLEGLINLVSEVQIEEIKLDNL